MAELPVYTRPPFEVTAELDLVFPDASSEELETLGDRVLDVLEEQAGDVALGPAVSGDVEQRQINLIFSVSAFTVAELHQTVANVAGVLERNGLLHGPGGSQTSAPEPVCA
ncbi:MAG: hypothetical protein ACR2NB_09585 [Solirubrobacteraceae bacterium]